MKNVINIHSISKLLLFFALTGLPSCDQDETLTGVAAGAKGRYLVTAYIVSGDTLYSLLKDPNGFKAGINKIGVDNFIIAMAPIKSDQLMQTTSYWKNGSQSTFKKEIVVQLTNTSYQFTPLKTYTASAYEGRVGRFTGVFYERTVGGGVLIPLVGSAAANSGHSSTQDVIIIAQPAR